MKGCQSRASGRQMKSDTFGEKNIHVISDLGTGCFLNSLSQKKKQA